VLVKDRCVVCGKHIIGSESFWMPPMVLLGDEAQWKLDLARLEIVLILIQDRCMVCADHTTGP
jgi:carbonic anhydrase/acetyltransferase-like protein (isoleucine patch superfamily)